MNKSDVTAQLATKLDMTKVRAKEVVDALFDSEQGILSNALVAGDKVMIAGFGTFMTRERAARAGSNPMNGEKMQIPAKTVMGFRAGSLLKKRLLNK